MKRYAALAVGLMLAATASPSNAAAPAKPAKVKDQTIVFAGGCFWGIQSVFEHTKGVKEAVSGYAGGWATKPSYEEVSSGSTGHAESVKVTFDPAQVSLDQLMKVFFTVAHNPTELNYQGPDRHNTSRLLHERRSESGGEEYILSSPRRAYGNKPIVIVPYKFMRVHHQHCGPVRIITFGSSEGGGAEETVSGAVPRHQVTRSVILSEAKDPCIVGGVISLSSAYRGPSLRSG